MPRNIYGSDHSESSELIILRRENLSDRFRLGQVLQDEALLFLGELLRASDILDLHETKIGLQLVVSIQAGLRIRNDVYRVVSRAGIDIVALLQDEEIGSHDPGLIELTGRTRETSPERSIVINEQSPKRWGSQYWCKIERNHRRDGFRLPKRLRENYGHQAPEEACLARENRKILDGAKELRRCVEIPLQIIGHARPCRVVRLPYTIPKLHKRLEAQHATEWILLSDASHNLSSLCR